MEQKRERLYRSAPIENNDLEKRLEKKINDVNSFNNSLNNIKEMNIFFKDKNRKSKNKCRNYKFPNIILESVDTIVIIGVTSISVTLSITGIGLNILPITAGIGCTLSLGNKILHKLFKNKYNKYKKQNEKDQQFIEIFHKLYRKTLQDNVIDKTEYGSLSNFFTKFLVELKNESLL